MLKQASQLCRSVLFPQSVDQVYEAGSNIQVQYAACSVIKAFTANVQGVTLAAVKQQRQLAAAAAGGGSDGIVIHDSAVEVSMIMPTFMYLTTVAIYVVTGTI